MKETILVALALLCGALSIALPTSAQVQAYRRNAPTLPLSAVRQLSWLSQAPKLTPPQGQVKRRLPQTRENFDIRADHQHSLNVPAEAQGLTQARNTTQFRLKRSRPSVQIRWSSLSGTPSRLWSLTESLSAPSQADAEVAARRFLKENEDLFQLGALEVEALKVVRRYQSAPSGVTHLTLQQQVGGIEVFQADFTIHLDRTGAVLAASGELIPRARGGINLTRPRLTAAEALLLAAEQADAEITGPLNLRLPPRGADQHQEFDRAAGFAREVEARLVYFPLSARQLRLAWEFILWMKETPDVYLMVMDAERGSLLFRHNLTCYEENPLKPHGLVFTKDSPRPDVPHINDNPPIVEREDVPFRATPFNGTTIFAISDPHYDWWAGAPANNLISNNTDTHLDTDANNQPDEPRLQVADGNFSFPINFAQSPATDDNRKAAQVNLFYWINRYHDILYAFGFTEAAGNFQTNNFNLGGLGNDAIQADVQDGSGTNNANFSTPPDGRAGRVQMFLWSGNPQIDSSFDQSVIIHELTHGLSNRLVGNASGLTGMQSRGMGEGWSDYFGLVLLRNENDDPAASYPAGQYVRNNYARGIRRYPYSTNMTIFPLTFKDIRLNTEVHAVGEIWCNVLWEMRALLIQKYGFREGQRQSIQLVMDGLKLTPRAPSFIDARNAILLADRINNNGANQCLIWQAFAKRGMGFSASTTDASDGAPIEATDPAPYCSDTGTVLLDKSHYVAGETLRISLGDRNASLPARVQVASSVTGDQETITLSPEASLPGSFNGTIRLATGRARAGDGTLQGSVEVSDQIIVTYNDASTDNGSPAQTRVTAQMARERVFFEDSVEQGNQGWLASSRWEITNLRSASPTRCWTDSPLGNYANNTNISLTSPLFDLTGLSEVTLSIAHSYDLENGFDYGIIEYSTDDGATWLRVQSFTGTQVSFTQSRIRLRGLDHQARARIRFRLQSDAAVTADGWYIDDIRLTGRSANPSVIPPTTTNTPVIASLSPAFGPPAGGTRVTIIGTNFTENEDTTVTFDGLPATAVNVLGGTTITATTPPHAAGAVTVRVINRNGAAALGNGFTYYLTGSSSGTPTLASLYPTSGSTRGGTTVTLIGANFTPETTVLFGGNSATVTFINAHTLRVLTPASTITGAVDVTVSNGAAQAKLTAAFNYVATTPPTVQVLSPNGGETFFTGSTININWRSADNRAMRGHRIALFRSSGSALQFVADIATNVDGEAQSFAWTIPENVELTDKARIRVTAIDDEGAEAEAFSSNDFTLARRWESVAQLPVALQRLQVTTDGKFLYALGGRTTTSSASTVATLYRFDPAAAIPAWTSENLAPMPTGLNAGDAVFLKGKVYIPGGINSAVMLSPLHFAYEIASNTWTTVAEPPSAAYLYALAADSSRGVYYLTGGIATTTSTVGTTTVRSYDPSTNTWADLPPMSTARYGHEAALIEGKLYVVGGVGPSGGLTSGEVYDFETKKWSPIAPLNRARIHAVNFVGKDPAGNPLWFVVGGEETATGALLGTEVYDVRNNRWIALDNSFTLFTPRSRMGGAVLGGSFYAVGGSTPNTSNRAVERTRTDNITVIPFDQAPALAVPPAQIAVANTELKFTVSANDLGSGIPITITAAGLPPGASFTTTNATNNSVRGTFRWTPSPADKDRTFSILFTASDGQLSETRVVKVRVVEAGPLAAVNAADYRVGSLAADSIAAIFGANLAVRTELAQVLPLPLELAGTVVTINGIVAPLFFVSPTQVNFAVPPTVETGPATIIVSNPAGSYALGTVEIVASLPAIFTADATGRGDAAAVATVDGVNYQTAPFDVTVNGRPNILVLFGTGIRRASAADPNDDNGVAESVNITIDGRSAQVLYAGAQGFFAGLDQINVELPQSLAGGGPRRVEVIVTVNNVEANRVTIQIK